MSADAANVMRQALAGMLWSKQFFFFDGDNWLDEHNSNPLHTGYRNARNSEWFHMLNEDIISMPDKWEYPWYAAWDLAFHTLPLAIVDPDFAKQQMDLMLRGCYLHPNGQMPAYEWNFSDVNPPVHALATLFLHRTEQALRGEADVDFLKSAFNKLLLNFTWWVNRKDRFGKNVFEGGFLGLDNIGVFDRSAPLPTGGHLEQADGTAWMALFSQNMLELAVELAAHDPIYEDMVLKFVEHFYYIAAAMNRPGQDGMWDEEDGFYYDILRLPDGSATRLKVRSLVGLLPLCATTVIEKEQRERVPRAMAYVQERLRRMPELAETMHPTGPGHLGVAERGLLALVNPERLRRILTKMLDENEFLGPYGIRSISKFHEQHPYVFHVKGQEYRVDYLPAESNTGMFGGNSNWRGPVWMPVNALIIRALLNFYLYYGDNFKIECPTGSGKMMNLFEVSKEISDRLIGPSCAMSMAGVRSMAAREKFQTDPHWRDHILFYEYFHGDNGAGLGASHQTGWTGLVATLIELYGRQDSVTALELGKQAAFHGVKKGEGKEAAPAPPRRRDEDLAQASCHLRGRIEHASHGGHRRRGGGGHLHRIPDSDAAPGDFDVPALRGGAGDRRQRLVGNVEYGVQRMSSTRGRSSISESAAPLRAAGGCARPHQHVVSGRLHGLGELHRTAAAVDPILHRRVRPLHGPRLGGVPPFLRVRGGGNIGSTRRAQRTGR